MRVTVQQFDTTDCGAACLASVARYYRLKLPVWQIRQQAGTNRIGTSAYGLVTAAQKLGFDAKGVEVGPDDLKELLLPSIAHLKLANGNHHFVVLYKVGKRHVKIMDPAIGKLIKMSRDLFLKQWTGVVIMAIPSAQFKKGDKTTSNFIRLWNLIKPHKSVFIQSGFGAVAFSVLGLSTAFYIQKLSDFVLVGRNENLLHLLGVLMLVILIMQVVLGVIQSWFVLRVSQNIDIALISGYFRHLIRLPQRFFDSMRIGELISRINDAVKIRNFINQIAIESIVDVLIVLIAFLVMMLFSWQLALLSYAVVPVYLLIVLITSQINKKLERQKMEDTASLEVELVESLRSVKTVKQMGAEESFIDEVDKRLVNVLNNVYRSGKLNIFSSSSMHVVNRLLTLAVLWSGAGLVIQTQLTNGELMSFFAITAYFTGPVSRLVSMNKIIHGALIAMDRLFELLELESEDDAKRSMEIKKSDVGDIVFDKVSFSYTLEKDLLEDFNLRVKAKAISVFLGDSGSGKSTLGNLIQGLYPLNKGMLKIGNIDVQHAKLADLRKVVGIVSQNIELFAGNVIENIALGDVKPDTKRISEIVSKLQLEEIINDLPEGLYTWLGENAIQLSGGQRQRLAIARMLYLNPQIYIFDEATSFLDDRSEAIIKSLIKELKEEGKTIIVIAHRMSTIDIADEIFVFQKGTVIQSGSFTELSKDVNGRFYEMLQHHTFS